MATMRQMDLSHRDEAILTDLYFTRILSTQQIATKYFKTYNSAKARLAELADDMWIIRRNPYTGTTIWLLTRPAFVREVEGLRRYGECYRDWPKAHSIPHFLDTNDVFIDISEEMDGILGERPNHDWMGESTAWNWKQEPLAREAFKDGEGKGVHQPDAEIAFDGNRYFLERQTERARKTAKQIDDKINDDYRRYIRRQRRENFEGEMEVLYACDKERDMRYADAAGARHGVEVITGKPDYIAEYIVGKAMEARSRRQEEDHALND
ncbi:MAG: replication-relaxation family protein [Rubrobacter sp.]|nr:replication-relaxation family protein [Rubrobacter sp.]